MKLAKDLMTKKPLVINSGDEVSTVIKMFVEQHISSAPVRSNTGIVMGMMTELGLVRAAIRRRLNKTNEKTQMLYQEDLLVPAVMINETAPLDEVIKQMLHSPSNRIVVVNGAKNIVGIISPKDILAAVFSDESEFLTLRKRIDLLEEQTEELRKQLKTTKDIMEKYQKIFDDSPAMIHSVDKTGTIIMANKRLHQVLGYKDKELIGRKLTDLYANSCHGEALNGLKTIQEKGKHQNIYSTMVTKEGERIRVDLVSSSLKDHHGNFLSTITAARPIDSESLLRALHGAFKDSKIEELELEKLVTRFDEDK